VQNSWQPSQTKHEVKLLHAGYDFWHAVPQPQSSGSSSNSREPTQRLHQAQRRKLLKDSQARATAASVCLTLIPALAALVTQLPCINAFTDVQVGNIMVPSQQVNSIVEKADVQATSQSPEKALQILHAHHRIAQLHHCQPNWVHIVDCVYDLAFHCIEKLI
jgi:hypothetical protein